MKETRVLHVVATSQRRGAEIFAADLIHALDELGTAQLVAVLRPASSDPVEFGAVTLEVGGDSSRKFGAELRQASSLRRLVRQWKPSVIQSHGGEALKASVLAFAGVPIIYRRIGGAPPGLRGGWRKLVYRRLVARSALVVAVAEAVREESISLLGIPPRRIATIPNAVDPERLAVTADAKAMRKTLGIADSTMVFVSVGALTWEKDPLALLRVGANVLRQLPDSIHLLLGDGPMRASIEQEMSSLGMGGRMQILGSRTDAVEFLALADTLLCASRPDGMEGMPAVLIEAGMLGTPAVAYDVAGVGEVVIDGKTGRLVPWGEEEALSSAVVDVLGNAVTRSAMGAAARQRCLERFSIAGVAPQYQRLYEEVLAE